MIASPSPVADLEDSLHHVAPAEQQLAIGFRELRMRRDEGLHDGAPAGKRALQDEVVGYVDQVGFIDGRTAGAFPQRLAELPREAPGTRKLDQLPLEVAAMIQQACYLGRRGGAGCNERRSRRPDLARAAVSSGPSAGM